MRQLGPNAARRLTIRSVSSCAGAVALASVATMAAAQESTPATPPDTIHDPDGPVGPGDLARGDIDVEGVPVHDNAFRAFAITDRLEYQSNDGDDKYVWDVFGYVGGDYNRLWIESEGEGLFDDDVESADLQVLYSRAVTPYWNLQAGWRRTFEPEELDYFVLSAVGLNVYWTGMDLDLYVSEDGDVSGAFEMEYDELFTQRLKLQPRLEFGFQFQDIEERDIGAGITDYEVGLRLRYEIVREFAPYVGISWAQPVFETADLLPDGEDDGVLSGVLGVRMWY